MKKDVIQLTKEGLQNFKDELENLKNVRRPEIINQLQEAKMLGDLSENADYDAARNLQAVTEARISELEMIIEKAKIIRVSKNDDTISIGKTVRLKYVGRDKEKTFKLIASLEANPFANKISTSSPIGESIIGARVGDVVTVRLENGKTFSVEILEVTNE